MKESPLVEELVDRLLNAQTTPEEVCKTCPKMLPKVRARWQRLCHVRAELDALFPPALKSNASPPPLPPEETALPRIPGYEVEAVLGRGGMGVVFRARHLRLNRVVALKMALAGAYAGRQERERFQREAEAVAGLQHPNVVQIHDVGESEGQPYFTMELLEGGNLTQKLAGTPQPALEAAQILTILAGAVQAAHESGILHRDLKPGNVLLTSDGTPKISDFGLARRLDYDPGLTRSGTPLGTPSYMAPEQAEGKTRELGPAVDIYALGALLYELLTGRPPFRAETAAATLQQVIAQDPAPPSRLNDQVPRDLETICLKCLRKDPEKRYDTARELIDDLGRFARGEPVAARPVGMAELLKNWLKRRPAAAGLLVAVALFVGTGSTGAWQFYHHASTNRERRAQTDREVSGILDRARFKLEEGWRTADLFTLRDAQTDASRAADVARSGGASPAMRAQAEALELETAGRLTHARKNHSLLNALLDVSASNEISTDARVDEGRMRTLAQPSVDEQYAAAFRAWGLDVDGAPEDEVAARLSAEPAVVGQEIVAALDNWILERRRQPHPMLEWRRLVRLSERLDGSDQHRRLRVLLIEDAPSRVASVACLVGSAWSPFTALLGLEAANNRRQLVELQAKIDPRTEPALTVVLLAQAFAAAGDVPRAEQMLVQAVTARPDQVVLLDHLGKLLLRQGTSRLGEAIGYLQAARGQRRELGLALSKALLLAGRAAQAEEVSQELVRKQPDKSRGWFSLGSALAAQQKYPAAETAYRKAIELDPDFAEAHYNLGVALDAQQKHGDAEAAYRKAINLKPNFVEAHVNLGSSLHRRERYEEAEAACRKAIDLKPDLAVAHGLLGNVLVGRQKYRDAERAFRKAIELTPHFAAAHSNLANVLLYLREYGAAEAASRKAIELAPGLPEAYSNLGDALEEQEKFIEAEPIFRKAIDLGSKNPWTYLHLGVAQMGQAKFVDAEAAFRKAIEIRPNLAEAHHNLGSALVGQKKYVDGEAAYRKAIEFKPDLADAYYHLGGLFLRSFWKLGLAEGHFRKAIEFNPNYAEAYFDLGMVLEVRLKLDDAEAAYRKAAELKPSFIGAQLKIKAALFRKGKFDEAEALCRKVIELRPDSAEAYCDLGRALSEEEKYGLAQAAWQKAIELKPGDADAHLHFGIALAQQEKYDAAEVAFRKTIGLKPHDAAAYSNLGIVLRRQQKYRASEMACRKAIELKPNLPDAYFHLGLALMRQTEFDEAAKALKKAGELFSTKDPRAEQSRLMQQKCRQFTLLNTRLQGVLQGTEKVANAAEKVEFARLCDYKRMYAAAARCYREAFTADPKLAELVTDSTLYDAACDAALAGNNQGADSDRLNDRDREAWRQQALAWLQQELVKWARELDSGNLRSDAKVRRSMQHWQTDTDLAGLRDKEALARLSVQERAEWERFWSSVDSLLRHVPELENRPYGSSVTTKK